VGLSAKARRLTTTAVPSISGFFSRGGVGLCYVLFLECVLDELDPRYFLILNLQLIAPP
jgi:hypothetical protein